MVKNIKEFPTSKIHRRRLYPEVLVKLMLIDVCRALVSLHANNWLHLDLNPCNVVMSEKYFKIIDFGLSELVEPD